MAERKKVEKLKYNPSAKYEWNSEDNFTITGKEVEDINNALKAAASTPDFQRFAALYQGLVSFNNFFKELVEDGLVREIKEEVKGTTETADKPKK
jgi:hypothetical protein